MRDREKMLEAALVECFDAAIPQAMPWTGTFSEKADYAAKTLPEQLRGLNRLYTYHARLRAELVEALEAINESASDGRDVPEWLTERLLAARAVLAKVRGEA